MKPLLSVVALSLLLSIHALPENIEDVKELPQSKEPVVEAEESNPQARVERCTTCASLNLKVKSPKEILSELQALPGAEVHSQQSFESCSTDKGCAGLKVKDGNVVQRYGNIDAFNAAAAADVNKEFTFHAGNFGSNTFEGGIGSSANKPFWWMDQDSPFKGAGASANFERYSKSSSFSNGASGALGAGALNLAGNPFLNGQLSKVASASQTVLGAGIKPNFQSSYESYSSSNNGAVDLSQNPFLNAGLSGASGFQGAFGAKGAVGSQKFGGGYSAGFGSGSKLAGGYTGSSPSPIATATGSNVNLIQSASDFDYAQQQTQQNINDIFQSGISTGGVGVDVSGGELQQACSGQGYVCALKSHCTNGIVNANFAALLQAKAKKQYCNLVSEICCRIDASTLSSGLVSSQASAFNSRGTYGQSGYGKGTTSGFGLTGSGYGSTLGSGGIGKGTKFGSGTSSLYGSTFASKGYGLTGSTVPFGLGSTNPGIGSTTPRIGYKSTGQFSLFGDSLSAGSEVVGVYRPGAAGSVLKPGIPYLPPVDNTISGTNIVSSTVLPNPTFVTTPRPFTTAKPTYLPPPISSTAAPGYLPPIGEQTINRETIVPPYSEGSIYLDQTRTVRPPIPPPILPSDIPAGCAAALKCTPIEFCTAEGMISNTTVFLTREQDAYRVPLTDCRDILSGTIGKCCRDPYYTDPWPTNQLGKWVPGVFGGNDGKYVPDSKVSPNNIRPTVTVRPPVTGSVLLNNFITPTPSVPTYKPIQVTPSFPSSTITPIPGKGQFGIGGQGQYGQGGQGQYSQGGQGQYSQGGQGQYSQGGQGQYGLGGRGQIGITGQGSQVNTAFTQGQRGQVGLVDQGRGQVNRGQGAFVTQGQGQYGQAGVGQVGIGGLGQYEIQGQGQQSQFGVGTGQKGVGVIQGQGLQGEGLLVSQGGGTAVTHGTGFGIREGQGQFVNQGQGTLVSQGVGQGVRQGQGQFVSQGQGSLVSQGVGQGVRQGQGQFVNQDQGSLVGLGIGQGVAQGQGQFVSQGQGSLVSQGVGQGVRQGQGQIVSQGQGALVSQGVGQGVRQGQGQFVSQGQGSLVGQGFGQGVRQGEGQFVSQGQGSLVGQGVGQGVRQGQGQFVTQGQGSLVSQGFGEGVSQGQGTLVSQGVGQGVSQGQGQFVTQGQGSLVSQGFGQGVRQGEGQFVSQGQGSLVGQGVGQGVRQGQGQYVTQGEGAIVSQGVGQGVRQGQGQFISQGEGALVSQGVGQGVRQGQGAYVTQGQGGLVSQGEGGLVTQGQGAYVSQGLGQGFGQGQGEIVSQGFGQGVIQGEGQLGSQGGGALVSQGFGTGIRQGQGQYVNQGQGELVSQGFGQGIRRGQGQLVSQGNGQYVSQGQGVITSQGFGQSIRQGVGQVVTQGQGQIVRQGQGFGVENEYGESVNRVILQRYNGGGGQCGVLNPQKPNGIRRDLEVDFAEIPWQAMVLLQTNRSLLCGGVITRPDVVVTSAACVEGLVAKNVLIKGGEWKLGIDDEPLPFQIVQVKTILRHPFYKPGSLHYDAAILVLAEDLRFAKNIYPICLPRANENLDAFYDGAGECIVTGWGKQVLQAHLAGSIMHSLNVSLITPGECQAKLSSDYPHLLEQYDEDSCVCGQPTNPLNNICRVDIGSALACTTGNGQFVMRGVYSWDSGCAVGNQIAAFYKFDLEWYEWAIGLIESVRFAQYSTVTKIITTKITGIKGGIKGTGVKTVGGGITSGSVSRGDIANLDSFGLGKSQFGFGTSGQSQFSSSVKGFTGKVSSQSNSQTGSGSFNFGELKPVTNGFSATYSEKKIFQSEPKIITYTTKPEIVTFTTKPEIVTFTTKPEIVTYTTKPEYFTYTTKPKIVTYTTKPKIVTYTTKPEIISYTTKPKIISYTTKPQFIRYETSGSGTNPQYVAPGTSLSQSFSEIIGKHTHDAKCKCNEGKK